MSVSFCVYYTCRIIAKRLHKGHAGSLLRSISRLNKRREDVSNGVLYPLSLHVLLWLSSPNYFPAPAKLKCNIHVHVHVTCYRGRPGTEANDQACKESPSISLQAFLLRALSSYMYLQAHGIKLKTSHSLSLRKYGVCSSKRHLHNEISTPWVAVNCFHKLHSMLEPKACQVLPHTHVHVFSLPSPSAFLCVHGLMCENPGTNRVRPCIYMYMCSYTHYYTIKNKRKIIKMYKHV